MAKTPYKSETSEVRHLIVDKWIHPEIENGVDLGFGGDPISIHSIAMDQLDPYACVYDEYEKSHPQHLKGNARSLPWFRDQCLDYVYSSHLLEDFPDTEVVLQEWLRVLRVGGKLVLALPDEAKFREHCTRTGQTYNNSHSQPLMAREWMCNLLVEKFALKILHSEDVGPYGFIVIAEKRFP